LNESGLNEVDGNIDLKFNKIKTLNEFTFNMIGKNYRKNNYRIIDYRSYSSNSPINIDFSNASLKSYAFQEYSFNVTYAKLIFDSNQPYIYHKNLMIISSFNDLLVLNLKFKITFREKYKNLVFLRSH
jgi:hypothetical protein